MSHHLQRSAPLTSLPFAVALVALVTLSAGVTFHAAVLKSETAEAFGRYVKLTEQRIDADVTRETPFLWMDGLPANRLSEETRRLREGGVLIERLETREGSKSIDVPDGLIHHWVGLVFVPDVDVDAAVALMQDYDRHAQIFSPNVAASKTLARNGQQFRVALRFSVKKVIAVTLDTENDAEFFRPASDRAYSRIRSTRVAEVANAGTPQEREKAPGQENGFMWRLNTYWRFLERDGGTYIQCESLTLSRGVPFALAWIIKPFVTQVPKESLTFTLDRASRALLKRQPSQ